MNGKKKLRTRRIQRLPEHLLPFNFTAQYLPGNKMHIMDILSRLAGKDLEPSDQLIPISFNVHTRSNRPLKQYYANKQKTSIPYKMVIGTVYHNYHRPALIITFIFPDLLPKILRTPSQGRACPAWTYACLIKQYSK